MSNVIEWSDNSQLLDINDELLTNVQARDGKHYRAVTDQPSCTDCIFMNLDYPCSERKTLPCESGDPITINGIDYRLKSDISWELI